MGRAEEELWPSSKDSPDVVFPLKLAISELENELVVSHVKVHVNGLVPELNRNDPSALPSEVQPLPAVPPDVGLSVQEPSVPVRLEAPPTPNCTIATVSVFATLGVMLPGFSVITLFVLTLEFPVSTGDEGTPVELFHSSAARRLP